MAHAIPDHKGAQVEWKHDLLPDTRDESRLEGAGSVLLKTESRMLRGIDTVVVYSCSEFRRVGLAESKFFATNSQRVGSLPTVTLRQFPDWSSRQITTYMFDVVLAPILPGDRL